ncbi:MAG: CHAT domain-containing protein [Gammaproteobacteria bacterium]|nr:CHAT domain-containing protein [Gammaproteobacteria bacterium]NIX01261.1 CHAT domain-containing protein [Phycisphaerae bacterium]
MSDLHVLVIDDSENWQEALPDILQRLADNVQVDVAPTYDIALQFVNNKTYDLATVDMSLLGDVLDDQLGLDLLQEFRDDPRQEGCGLVVVSNYPTPENILRSLREHGAHDFIEKDQFDDEQFLEVGRAAILNARLRQATIKASARYSLTINFNLSSLVGSELAGPNLRSIHAADHPQQFNATDLVRRADNLNLYVLHENADLWRSEARSIGQELYHILTGDRRILGDLASAQALAERSYDLWLRFRGPAISLGTPFELLRDGNDALVLKHILTHAWIQPGFSRKPGLFHRFLRDLYQDQQTLRILVVGANSDGYIPAAEQEAHLIAESLKRNLQCLGIAHKVTLLSGPDATCTNVSQALQQDGYHLFHYAGHGRFSDQLPEVSDLVLQDGVLTAADLNLLVSDTPLRFVFLSCCLGSRTAAGVGRGDFHGMLEALARADIPIVLGYRWTVADTPAMDLALDFYHTLWRTFSPGEALLQARRNIARKYGLDDDTWAAPVLLMQNQ